MAISRTQYVNYASSAKALTHTLAWTSTTGAGALLLACVGWNEEGSTVTQSIAGGSGSWTLLTGTPVERITGGLGQLKGAVYYKQNAAAQSGNVTLTLSAAHHATIHLVEYAGVATSGGPDVTATSSGTSTTPVSGTTATLAVASELRAGFLVAKNVNAETSPTNSYTQVGETGQSSGGGAAERSGYYEKIIAGTTGDGVGCTVSASVDYVGMIATWKPATAASLVQLSSLGSSAGPRQFPLGPPDMTGAITITDTTPSAVFTPTHPGDPANSGLRSGVDYIISCPAVRSRRMSIIGGRNVYVPQYLMKFASATPLSTAPDGWMVGVTGGDTNGIVHFDTVHLDNNRLQCDAFKTFKQGGTLSSAVGSMPRTVQIRNCVVEKLVGQSSQVHADLFQTSGGCGDTWIEDFTGSVEYDGFMHQQEANCENQTTFFTVTNATSAGGNYTYTTSAAHGYNVGDTVVVYNCLPAAFNGGYTCLAGTTGTTIVAKRGDTASPGAFTQNGRVAEIFFAYTVGSINLNRVNIKGFTNEITGGATNQSIRFGARTTPDPNPGNPGTILGLPAGHVNEDQTPLNVDQWAGTLSATNWYGVPDAGNIADWVEPDSNTNNYSVARPTQHAAAGGQPAYASWDNHPNVVAGTKFQLGPPPGGDYVTINTSGIPVPRVTNPSGGAGVAVKTLTQDAQISTSVTVDYKDAYDTFTRTVAAGGLGTSDFGGTYTLTGTAADFSANGSQAVVAVTAAGQTKRAVLANVSMFDQYATATMQTDTLPAGSYTAFDVYVGYVDANNWYRARVMLFPSGLIQIRWDMNLSSVLTVIKAAVSTSLTVQTANDYTILATATGLSPTTLNAYVWDSSAPPPLPIPYQVSATDSSGLTGLLTSLSLLTSPTVLTGPPGVSAAGFGAALNAGSTATATKVSCTGWDVWPTRMSVSSTINIVVPDTRTQVIPFAPPGPNTKHRWTPR